MTLVFVGNPRHVPGSPLLPSCFRLLDALNFGGEFFVFGIRQSASTYSRSGLSVFICCRSGDLVSFLCRQKGEMIVDADSALDAICIPMKTRAAASDGDEACRVRDRSGKRGSSRRDGDKSQALALNKSRSSYIPLSIPFPYRALACHLLLPRKLSLRSILRLMWLRVHDNVN